MMRSLFVFFFAVGFAQATHGDELQVHSRVLPNGVGVTYLYVEDSPSLSMFTLLPLGLAVDGPGQTQWSHLLEHMVLRTTIADGTQEANAETLSDHMRLDYYGSAEKWREALGHHARWLAGLPLPAERLDVEKQRANSEVDFASKNLASHKFAIAAWNQAIRHSRTQIGVKQDLAAASLDELSQYRDERLVVLDKTRVCAVGGVEPEELLDAVAAYLGGLESHATASETITPSKAGRTRATWDVPVGHLLVSWPIVGVENTSEYAALTCAAQMMMARAAVDAELKKLCGPVFAGVDLTTPEGSHIYVSVTLRSEADAGAAEAAFADLLNLDAGSKGMLSVVGPQLAQLRQPSLLKMLKAQIPDSAKAEAQFGLMWGLYDFQTGPHRSALVTEFERQNAESVQAAMKRYLLPATRTTLVLGPQ